MIETTCQDCGGTILYSEETVKRGLEDGSIIEGHYVTQQRVGSDDYRDVYTRGMLYICKRCQAVPHKVEPDAKAPAKSEAHEAAELHRLYVHVRSMQPDWTPEMIAHEAVERYNDVASVKDPAFRAYLMDRPERDY